MLKHGYTIVRIIQCMDSHSLFLPGAELVVGWNYAVLCAYYGLCPAESRSGQGQTQARDGTHLVGQFVYGTVGSNAQEVVEGFGVEAHASAEFMQGDRAQVLQGALPDVGMDAALRVYGKGGTVQGDALS